MTFFPRRDDESTTLNAFRAFQSKFRRVISNPGRVLELARFKSVAKLFKAPPIGSCSHLKGKGPYVDKKTEFSTQGFPITDYNIMDHVFPNGERVIKCLRCKQEWREGKPGWEEALEMTKNTTNTRTSSEQVLDVSGQVVATPNSPQSYLSEQQTTVVFQDRLPEPPMVCKGIVDTDDPTEDFKILSIPTYKLERLPEIGVDQSPEAFRKGLEAYLNNFAFEGWSLVTIHNGYAILFKENAAYFRKRGKLVSVKPGEIVDTDLQF